MKFSLRKIDDPQSEHRKGERMHFTVHQLAKLSGIPRVQKLKVDAESLVNLMVGLQMNIEDDRRCNEDTVTLYDPHYLSGLVALPSPQPTIKEPIQPRWPLVSPKGRKKRTLKIMDKVPEESDTESIVGRPQRDQCIISTEILYEAPDDSIAQISPRQISDVHSEPRLNGAAEALASDQSWKDMTNGFPDVPFSAKSMPGMTDDSTSSHYSSSTASTHSKAPSVTLFQRRRAQSESSIDTMQLRQQHKPSLHMHSPWIEELYDSFDFTTEGLLDGMLGARGPLDAQQMYGKPMNWGNTPVTTRNQSLASQMGSLGKYRTTRIPSAAS